MKKFLVVLLSVLCAVSIAGTLGLAGCKKEPHSHVFDQRVLDEDYLAAEATCTEGAKYYYSCKCGAKGTETFKFGRALGHSFTNYVSDNNATCTKDGTKTAKCDRCDETDTIIEENTKLEHSYTEQVVNQIYLASSATCTKKAMYYYSCKCGAVGTETFEYGSTTNHNYVNGVCTYCGKEQQTSQGLEFTLLDDGTYEVSGIGSCTDTEIVIPSIYNDQPVTRIGEYAFSGYNLISVIIPDTVIGINWHAFEGCSALMRVTIPGSVTTIGEAAFGGSGLTSVTIEKGVSYIGRYAFNGCVRLVSVTIPDSVDFIGEGAFFYCLKLVEVINNSNLNIVKGNREYGDIGSYALDIKKGGKSEIVNKNNYLFYTSENVNYLLDYIGKDSDLMLPSDYNGQSYRIYDYAFAVRNELTRITIPDKVTGIGYAAFTGCSGVESIIVSAGNTAYSSINNCLIDTASGTLIFGCKNSVIPNDGSVTTIGDGAFNSCSDLTSIIIPDGVLSIGDYAFGGCSGLTSINIPDSVTNIGSYAFAGCSNLTIVTIPDSVTSMGERAFEYCAELISVVIGNGVTVIGDRTFSGCADLTSITVGSGLTSISDGAFSGCSRLTNINICNIEAWCKITGLRNLMSDTSSNKKLYINGEEITELIIPDSVTYIEPFAFYNCSGLISITIPDSVNVIGSNAFEGCNYVASINIGSIESWCNIAELENLMRYGTDDKQLYLNGKEITELIIPDSVTNIEAFAFYNCSGLISITIPDSVTSIDDCAFSCCLGLKNIIIPDSVISIGIQAFYHCENVESIEVSKNNSVYSAVNNCLIKKETKTLIFGCRNSIIPDDGSVTTIGVFAFDGCRGLTSIVIPNRVNKISMYAFNLCYDLLSVTIGSNVKTIETGAFENCFKLIEIINKCDIEITKGSTENGQVGYNAVVIKKDGESEIENVDGFLFYTYENINYLLGYTGNDAELILPDTYKGKSYEMNHDVFLYRYDLNSIFIGNSVTNISDFMFFGCGNLRSVIIGSNVKSIGVRAFAYCESLTSITYKGTVEEWENITKGNDWKYNVPSNCVIHCIDGNISISD